MLQVSSPLAASLVGLVLVGLLTLPSIYRVISHFRSLKEENGFYEDKDGVASEKSMKEFSTKTSKVSITIFATAGLLTSIALAVLETIHEFDGLFFESWLNAGQWFLLLIQVAGIITIRNPVKTYALGISTAFSSGVVLVVTLFQDGLLAQEDVFIYHPGVFWLRLAQLPLALAVIASSISIPRRPIVFHDGKPLDGMYTVSAFKRYTFSWVADLLAMARAKNRIEQEDLPRMDHYTRSKDLTDAWDSTKHTQKLWIEVFLAHKESFITQWSLTFLQAIGNFAPQFVVYSILKILEKRRSDEAVGVDAWIWVVALTLVTGAAACIESWLYWISWSDIAIPIRAQLAALIFSKAMRRKDVKGATKQKESLEAPIITDAVEQPAGDVKEEEDSDPQGKQSTVNLIGVDAKRVSDFASFNNFFLGSIFKLAVSFAFLLSIIGWKALLAGMIAMGCTTPVNIFFSKRYAAAQDRLMKVRDTKMGIVTEALQGLRQIKYMALEQNWHAKIGKVRERELSEQWAVYKADTFLVFCWITGPIALAAASLAVYAWEYGELTPAVAFTSIGVFSSLEVVLGAIPELITDVIDAYISINRIEAYLTAPEISQNTSDSPNISFDNASIAWPSDEEKENTDLRYVLRDINISFPENELSVVSGKTGTGKSLLLAAILGEVDVLSGKVNVPRPPLTQDRRDDLANRDNWIIPSSIAFVAQIPWIENATIKDNILFGLPDDPARYQKVIEVCALKPDLAMFPDGENTEIGANGINMSGGQRWRVTFARALYSRAGILVLDDIFSAVDAHVGRHLFEKALCGELSVGRTRILVTHHVALCKSKTKYVVELGDGTIEHAGFLSELEEDGTLEQIISHEDTKTQVIEDESTAVNSEESSDVETIETLKKINSKTPKKFVEDETREQGRVKTRIYIDYIKASGGWPFWALFLAGFTINQCLITGRSWWLRLWTGDEEQHSSMTHAYTYSFQTHLGPHNSTVSILESNHSLQYYLGIYVALSVVTAIVGTLRYFYLFIGSIRASRKLFDDLCFTVLRTPLRWIDVTPIGRILNRFTTDFQTIDSRLSNTIGNGSSNLFRLVGIIIAGTFVSPWIILLSLGLLAICIQIARLYIVGAREVKRLEANAKSPVFEQFGSALTGVGTIRAFDKSDTYIVRMYSKIDAYSTAFWHLWAFNRWMGYRMALVGSLFATCVSVGILMIPNIDAALAGFALSFALDYGGVVIWTIRHYANLELDMNAAERIVEYSKLTTESLEGADPPAHWPSEGRIEVHDLVAGYAPDLPAVLKGLSFSARRNERIGVVGRTGAGKSTINMTLFRFLEARSGSVHIDGIDISKIKLQALRSRLAIIPQDPTLFAGTVRTNLDAFDDHTDAELREALLRVHLISQDEFDRMASSSPSTAVNTRPGTPAPGLNHNKNPFTSLMSPITEGGANLSQGQRQLLCLARAIVSRPKIMLLDEATSAVDMSTDVMIQRSIREEFGDSTLVVIAHRLSTIADFDRILVLNDGKGVEFGTPKELYAIEDGVFRGMVGESGEKEQLIEIIEKGASRV